MMPSLIANKDLLVIQIINPLVMLFYLALFYGWYWSVVFGLGGIIPRKARPDTKRFKLLFFLSLIFTVILIPLFSIQSSATPVFGLFAFILPLHILALIGLLYCMYFTAKTIKTAQLKQNASYSDFAGLFFLLWIFPIGIWIIQPKINKLIIEE